MTAETNVGTFSTRVKAARESQGLTLKQAAEQIGISLTVLFNAEHGARPHQANRSKIALWLERVERDAPNARQPITSVGALLCAVFAAQGMTQIQIADEIGVSTKHLSQIVTGKVGLSHELAFRLESVTGVPAMVWNAAEAAYRDARIRQQEARDA